MTLQNFRPTGAVTFPLKSFPLEINDGQKQKVKSNPVTSAKGVDVRVVYSVMVGTDVIDPDLIIDGDPIIIPRTTRGGKKAGRAASGPKRGGKKKKAGKRR